MSFAEKGIGKRKPKSHDMNFEDEKKKVAGKFSMISFCSTEKLTYEYRYFQGKLLKDCV